MEHSISVHPVGNWEMYLTHYAFVRVGVGSTQNETREYVTRCFKDRFGEAFGTLRSVDVPLDVEGELDPRCPDGDVVDMDMGEGFIFDVEPEVGEEHDELGGVDLDPAVADPSPEPTEEGAADPMDVEDDLRRQDPRVETESEEDMSSEDDPEAAESSSESSGSDPDRKPQSRS